MTEADGSPTLDAVATLETDEDLFEQWRRGAAAAGDELLARHRAELEGFFGKRSRGEMEDLVQETFLQCLRSREGFRGEARFRSFLFGVAHNVLRMHYRRHPVGEAPVSPDAVDEDEPSPASMLASETERALLLKALRRLPLDAQILVELRYSRGLDSTRIAEILGVPAPTVRTRLMRARELIREGIEQLGADRDLARSTLAGFDTWAERVDRMRGG
ncbi:MAG: sigma-70 family RNA polymerase sigma factor [Polyangiaceae bacterium]|nr:sigma-70 family RNA polymerase sigma factor [Polyangiaceae bacterium]